MVISKSDDIPMNPDMDRERSLDISEPELSYDPHMIDIFKVFKKFYDPSSVLYPCCGNDASPAKVFDDVTFVDNGKFIDAISLYTESGLKAYKEDILDYRADKEHDLLIILNPSLRFKETEYLTKHIISKGYIISNDWHENARWMFNNPDKYSLEGCIETKNGISVSTSTKDLFKEIKDAKELKEDHPKRYAVLKNSFDNLKKNCKGSSFNHTDSFDSSFKKFKRMADHSSYYKRIPELYIFSKR